MEKLISTTRWINGGKKLSVISGIIILLLSGSYGCKAVISTPAHATIAEPDTSVSAFVKQYLNGGKSDILLYYPNSVKRFYEANDMQAAWVKEQTDPKQTWEAMLMLDCVLQFGLSHADYHPQELLYNPLHDMLEEQGKISNSKKARFDILLTDALITFMNHLHYGKLNPDYSSEKIDSGLMIPFHAETALLSARQQKDFMSAVLAVQPKSKQYAAMQDRMRLLKGQYLEDCYVIPETEVRQIAINMERLRWAEIGGDTYIQINIPSFNLKFYQPDTVYEFRVVVGKVSAPTPRLNSNITYFTTFPEWKIPQKIFREEILPKALQNSAYLENSHFSIYNNAGNYIAANRSKLLYIKRHPELYYARQSSGCDNALGNIVFRFPNIYDIYLHDTPEKQLFNKKERAFSHSCIRVEQAQELAVLILKNDRSAQLIPALNKAMRAQLTKNISLKKPLPIKITYLTCEVKEGLVITYPDIYNLDKSLEMALYITQEPLTMK
jgi:L,D-transpeptidase YcbB